MTGVYQGNKMGLGGIFYVNHGFAPASYSNLWFVTIYFITKQLFLTFFDKFFTLYIVNLSQKILVFKLWKPNSNT